MNVDHVRADLEASWSAEDGFLFLLRTGSFDPTKAVDLLEMLRKINLDDDTNIVDRRLVSLLWYLPLFLSWQRERVEARDAAALAEIETQVCNQVERILGVP